MSAPTTTTSSVAVTEAALAEEISALRRDPAAFGIEALLYPGYGVIVALRRGLAYPALRKVVLAHVRSLEDQRVGDAMDFCARQAAVLLEGGR